MPAVRGGVGVLAGLEYRRPGQVELALPGCQLPPRRGRERFRLPAACAEPRCSMLREPRWEAYTICIATAPEAIFTVRTYAKDETTSSVSAHPPVSARKPAGHSSASERTPTGDKSQVALDMARSRNGRREYPTRSSLYRSV